MIKHILDIVLIILLPSHIVKANGGEIEVNTKENERTEFINQLPVFQKNNIIS